MAVVLSGIITTLLAVCLLLLSLRLGGQTDSSAAIILTPFFAFGGVLVCCFCCMACCGKLAAMAKERAGDDYSEQRDEEGRDEEAGLPPNSPSRSNPPTPSKSTNGAGVGPNGGTGGSHRTSDDPVSSKKAATEQVSPERLPKPAATWPDVTGQRCDTPGCAVSRGHSGQHQTAQAMEPRSPDPVSLGQVPHLILLCSISLCLILLCSSCTCLIQCTSRDVPQHVVFHRPILSLW